MLEPPPLLSLVCAGGSCLFPYTHLQYLGVCASTCVRNQARGHGGQIGRGQQGSECMLGAGEYNLCTLRGLKLGRDECEVKQRREGAARTDPVAKTQT